MDTNKQFTMSITGASGRDERENGTEIIFEKIMAKNF